MAKKIKIQTADGEHVGAKYDLPKKAEDAKGLFNEKGGIFYAKLTRKVAGYDQTAEVPVDDILRANACHDEKDRLLRGDLRTKFGARRDDLSTLSRLAAELGIADKVRAARNTAAPGLRK